MQKTNDKNRGIHWNLNNYLEDIDYADDICLLHTHTDMQVKFYRQIHEANLVGLRINVNKTKSMHVGTNILTTFHINNEHIDNVTEFCYLGSIITVDGGTKADISNRIK